MESDYHYCTIDPALRWHIGHHSFFLIIQSQIKCLLQFEASLKAERWSEAKAALEKATNLMLGAGAAMRFAGDFAEEAYTSVVRPAMSAPNVGEGFSGDLSRDHSRLVQLLRRLDYQFKTLPDAFECARAKFEYAVSVAYEAHKNVCAKFKGNEVHSLRMQAGTARTSVDELDRRKYIRLQNIARCPHAEQYERSSND